MGKHTGRVALVTGAAQGLGRAVAVRLAAEGARVALVDRTPQLCSAVMEEITASGGVAIVLGGDLQTYSGNAEVVNEIVRQYGEIDVAVFNVGGTIWAQPFWEYLPEQIEAEIDRSLWPTIWGCYCVVPVMLGQGRGAIVNIGSTATRWALRAPYAAAKGGVHALTAALARDLAHTPLRVNCVSPGALETQDRITPRNPGALDDVQKVWRTRAYEQSLRDTPMGRAGNPVEVAGAVSFLASEDASYMTGQVMYVAGGAIG
jgi:dihydroxycyclohexadiene carboxylate dehydrogenase